MNSKYDINFAESWRSANTGHIATQSGRKERGSHGDHPDVPVLDAATRHLSAPETRRPTQKNLDRRAVRAAILRARAEAGHQNINRVIDAAERRGSPLTAAERESILGFAGDISRNETRRRVIDTIARMQTRRTPGEEAAQSASVRFHDTHNTHRESYEMRKLHSPSKIARERAITESYELYENVCYYLVNEGYADTVEDAEIIVSNLNENVINHLKDIVMRARNALRERSKRKEREYRELMSRPHPTDFRRAVATGPWDKPVRESYRENWTQNIIEARRPRLVGQATDLAKAKARLAKLQRREPDATQFTRGGFHLMGRNVGGPESEGPEGWEAHRRRTEVGESYDAYDVIISHLINEGYTDTIEGAETIAMSMSEDWMHDILYAI